MTVKVLFFGMTADLAGRRELILSPVKNARCGQVIAEVIDIFPELSKRKMLYSINQVYAHGAEILREGDELAIFTVVSGG
ncbi:MAG: MoaD/ThiS family protein [Pyrinomonadaceae bacterium]